MKTMKILLLIITISVSIINSCLALDIDDGIDIDDSITDYHELGKMQKNISYIVLNSISKSYTSMSSDDVVIDDANGTAKNISVNSVIVGSGSNIHGDIIIIDQSQGDKAAISMK
jgi:hypothetical protein